MQVTVTDYKTSFTGSKVAVDTGKIISIFWGNGVFDGRSMQGWNVVLRNDKHSESIFVSDDDIKLLRTVK